MKIYKNTGIADFLDRFESRRNEDVQDVEISVRQILQKVRQEGDKALIEYAKKFDNVDLEKIGIKVPWEQLKAAHESLDKELLHVLQQSRKNIERFHQKGLPQSWISWEENGVALGQKVSPLERVGVYVPGGRAAYPSSLLMGVVPAQVAGVEEIVITTPSDADGHVNSTILAAAYELGIESVFRIGGAHAIAALAYGTNSVPQVDKIVGPGNIYVATAKKMLYGQCSIDMVAGPSEVLIIADKTAHPAYTAADLLAQAEHDPLASSILVTDSQEFAEKVEKQVIAQTKLLPRKEIIEQSLKEYGAIIVAESMTQCVELCNRLAPEHLGIHVADPWNLLGEIKNAGAIFLGPYSPEAVGDYWAGPNHVLPTNGSARFFSPLRTEDFLKVSSIISYTKEGIQKNGDKIMLFANNEGLQAHANSIKVRKEN